MSEKYELPSLPLRPIANQASVIQTKTHRITILTSRLIRFESTPENDGEFEDRASTFAINRDLPTPDFRKVDGEEEGSVEIFTDHIQLFWDGKAFTPEGLTVTLNEKLSKHTSRWRFGVPVDNLGGTACTLDTIDGRCDLDPGILSQQGFAVLDDSKSMILTADGWVASRKPGRTDYYLFAYGRDYKAALKTFYQVSGKQPLLPRWALGNWWCRYFKYTTESFLGLMDHFKEEEIPISVAVIDMDWHLVTDIPKGKGSGWTGFTWNKKLFPDPEGFMRELHDRGMQISLNTHPADGIQSYEDIYVPMCKALGRDPSTEHAVPFDADNKDFMRAYFSVLSHALEAQGCDMWWLDWQQGTHTKTPGIDPLWMLNHYHFLDSGRDGKRCITFSRYAGPGSHRYPVGFSGDTIITWDSLKFQPEFTATASNIGYGWWSHDIGGHWKGYKDNELATRWVQLGVWSPILRLHSSDNPFDSREPWRYNEEAQRVMTASLKLRHQLIPYIYTNAVRSATASDDDENMGESLIKPMYYDYPEHQPLAYQNKNQYMFGSQLLVSSITSPRDKSTMMGVTPTWLPPVPKGSPDEKQSLARWVDIFSGMVYEGDRVVNLHRRLEEYPVLAAEGAIIPLDSSVVLENACPVPGSLEILAVVGKDGAFELIEDDGQGAGIDGVNFSKTRILFKAASGQLTIGAMTNPLINAREWSIRLLSCTIAEINVKVKNTQSSIDYTTIDPKIKIEKVHNGTLIHLGCLPTSYETVLDLGTNLELNKNDVQGIIFDILDSFQMGMIAKRDILEVFQKRGEGLVVTLSRLRALELDEAVMLAVEEVLLADSRY